MSIPILTQVYDEVRRLSIAGSVVAPGDFRLKKLVALLEQSGQKAPVFAKVAQAVSGVVDSTDKTSAESLLELSTLVNAILYTQGETGLAGKLEPIKTIDLGLQVTQTSARVLKPLLEALSTTGSGRLEIIKDAHERGAFADLRLIKAALAALDDVYPDVAEFVSRQVLPRYGTAIIPELRLRFDQKGRAGHVRRLSLMHQLDPAGTRDIVKQALDEGSKEIKIVAIECLGESTDDLAFLLEQAKAKTKDVREAALKGLAKSVSGDAVAALRAALAGADIEIAVAPVHSSRDPKVLKFVLELATQQRDALLASKEKDKKEVGKQVTRFLSYLECLRGRDDKETEKFVLDCFSKMAALTAIKGDVSGKDIQQRLVTIMAGGSKKTLETLAEAHASFTEGELSGAFLAAIRVWTAKKVYDKFSPYMVVQGGEKTKKNDPVAAKQAAITAVLCGNWHWRWNYSAEERETTDEFIKKLDPRWLDLAVKLKDMDLVQRLARSGHSAVNQFLSSAFEEKLAKAKETYEFGNLLDTMVRVKHPDATDSLLAAMVKCAKSPHGYGLYWFSRLIPELPIEALPKLEALLPTLPEAAIDRLLDYVVELKNKAKLAE
jgi:hypothetical protein